MKMIMDIPDSLVERAASVGIELDDSLVHAALEERIQKVEAIARIRSTAARLQALPDAVKPSPDDIAAEISAYRRKQP
jgi:hypothetical protein